MPTVGRPNSHVSSAGCPEPWRACHARVVSGSRGASRPSLRPGRRRFQRRAGGPRCRHATGRRPASRSAYLDARACSWPPCVRSQPRTVHGVAVTGAPSICRIGFEEERGSPRFLGRPLQRATSKHHAGSGPSPKHGRLSLAFRIQKPWAPGTLPCLFRSSRYGDSHQAEAAHPRELYPQPGSAASGFLVTAQDPAVSKSPSLPASFRRSSTTSSLETDMVFSPLVRIPFPRHFWPSLTMISGATQITIGRNTPSITPCSG
jgi:hypothetical protein